MLCLYREDNIVLYAHVVIIMTKLQHVGKKKEHGDDLYDLDVIRLIRLLPVVTDDRRRENVDEFVSRVSL